MSCDEFIGNLPPGGGAGGPPDIFFGASKSGSQGLTDQVVTTVSFDTEDYDNGGWYAPSTANCPQEGLYLFQATMKVNFTQAGYMQAWFDVAGVGSRGFIQREVGAGNTSQGINISLLRHFAKNRLIQVRVFANTGAAGLISSSNAEFNGALLRAGPVSGGGP
jgi:hypothetical protein